MSVGAPALAGIRVIDLTTVIFGPSATQTLADYGADVIKVESPAGDTTRHTGPSVEQGMASLFLGSNRNKRSVVLNLKEPEAREALAKLISTADVVVHNIRPQKLSEIGLNRETLCADNPRLIFVGLHGFGETGPYGGRPAYDDIVQALSGAADLGRRQTGQPRYMPTIVADKVGGQMAVHAILAALFQRERTGRGQYVEVPMFEAMVQFLMTEHFNARHIVKDDTDNRPNEHELGYARTLAEWRKPYQTRDGFVCVMPYNDRDWVTFFRSVSRPDLADDPRFANITERTRNIEELYRLLEVIVGSQPTQYWLNLCERIGVACAPVVAMHQLERDEHLEAVNMFGVLSTGREWSMRYVRSPVRMEESIVEPQMPPRLGEHTREVLEGLGFSEELVDRLTSNSWQKP